MTIRRAARKQDSYTILQNKVLTDARLSFRARGVLASILSRPENWSTRAETLARETPGEGRDAIRRALSELETVGYLVREKVRDPRTGRIATVSTVHEEPVTDRPTPPQVSPTTEIASPAFAEPEPENPSPVLAPPEPDNPSPVPTPPGPGKPAPGFPATGEPDAGSPGPLERTVRKDRSTTTTPAAAKPVQPSTTPERAVVVEVDSDDELDALRSACRTAGITARWDSLRPDQAAEISHLITQHGIDALVRHAAAHQRSERPTLYVQGWIGSWQMLTAPRTDVPAGPTACTDCDHGWLDADALVACPTCRPNLARRAS